ncbi:hypothetical protein KDD30_10415 [Photobacterium sp. GJ3]|uniref:hypothetical protein n=1 Tax=Photobacterium sp. GJ3 TaxID=2829502 RepID=UPI001B8B242B|nr:hypothetical protein [Photobacterium sp. GJ3]QUJ66576.1 hypothetical protein KDD30_10415 [Photobacterium sp. GJ3]
MGSNDDSNLLTMMHIDRDHPFRKNTEQSKRLKTEFTLELTLCWQRRSAGLGMSIIRDIAQIHGGEIQLEGNQSSPMNCFRVTLPTHRKPIEL